MKIVLTHPTGNQNVRAVLDAFLKDKCLENFYTTIALDNNLFALNLLPLKLRQEFSRRNFNVGADKIKTFPFLELCRLILPKIGYSNLVVNENSFASVYSVYKNFDKKVAKKLLDLNKIDAVYAYEDGALETFKQAKKNGIKCIYDLPIAYWETSKMLLEIEADKNPAWKNTLIGIKDSESKLARKTEELSLADMVIGPGNFVIDSIPSWAKNKIIISSPFGSPLNFNFTKKNQIKNDQPLKVLFVGSMSQRKGLADLFNAMKLLNRKDVELIVMGSMIAPLEFYKNEYSDFKYEPGRPHSQVLELMKSCDVFCLPSIVEGRALVMQEAMSQGLPILITNNTGGDDLVVEGKTGFIVPISNPFAIAEKLNWFAENRVLIPEMGEHARIHAEKYTWDHYGNKIVNAIKTLF